MRPFYEPVMPAVTIWTLMCYVLRMITFIYGKRICFFFFFTLFWGSIFNTDLSFLLLRAHTCVVLRYTYYMYVLRPFQQYY